MAFHPGRGTVFLYGGVASGPGPSPLADTWEWDGATWTYVTTSPIAAWESYLAYDEARAVMVLYQIASTGSSLYAPHSELVNNAWVQVTAAPLGRFAYDP